jgi:hypothetical protein
MTVQTGIPVMLAACLTASGWLLGKWLHSPRPEPSWRKRSGLAGLAVGAVSSALLASFYLYAWAYHALLTHGLASWAYGLVGLALSALGVVLGAVAVGYLRLSALLISLVAAFEWTRQFAAVAETRNAIDVATFIVIGVLALACLGRRWYSGQSRASR